MNRERKVKKVLVMIEWVRNRSMKTRPILFSGPMVRAILEGRKTQTRRTVKHPPHQRIENLHVGGDVEWPCRETDDGMVAMHCPYGVVGDRLWVRETWMPAEVKSEQSVAILYKASNDVRPDGVGAESFGATRWFERPWEEINGFRQDIERMEVEGDKWRPSLFLPRWASRLTLEIVGVRVERLNEISEVDAIAEGVESKPSERWEGRRVWRDFTPDDPANPDGEWFERARDSYRSLWRSINGPESWEPNPYVWVMEFARVSNAQLSDRHE